MRIRKLPVFVLIVFLMLISFHAAGQKHVDMELAEIENKELFSGSFFRGGLGFARASYNYHDLYEDLVVGPVNFSVELGKRMNRKFGAYFSLSGNSTLKEVEVGLNDILTQWVLAGLNLGGLHYIKGGNSYFAAEIGMGLGLIETTNLATANTYGLGATFKYGYDRHIASKFFMGVQAFISYAYTWDPDQTSLSSGKNLTANAFLYGININFKIGK